MDNYTFSRERRLRIFKVLSAGPLQIDDIHKHYFLKADGNPTCIRIFNREIKKLKDNQYIDIFEWRDCYHKNGSVRLAILKDRGADFLCLNHNVERDHFRMCIPKPAHIGHELILSNIITYLRKEAESKNSIIEYIYDDTQMKRQIKQKRISGKNMYFPDLKCRVVFASGTVDFNIELDCGNKGRKYWSLKLGSWSDPTLLITLKPHRAERLANYALNNTYRRGMLCAVSLPDFYKVGLTHFKDAFLNTLDRNVYLYGVNI